MWEVVAAIRASGLEGDAALRATADWGSPELRGIPDDELFAHAQDARRAIVTYNRDDFLALDRQCREAGRDHHAIVILNPRRFAQGNQTIGALVGSLDAFLSADPPYASFVHWLQ